MTHQSPDMENNAPDQNQPEAPRIRFRRIRPRYRKMLIPFLILSLIVAIILIWVTNKYLFKPIFEKRGSLRQSQREAAVRSDDGPEYNLFFQT